MRRRTKRLHLTAAAMVALALGPAFAGCGGSGHDPTLTIGAGGTAEEEILGQIYAQALRVAGFTVARNVRLRSGFEAASEALESDSVSGYVEHLSTPSTESIELEHVPADPQKAYEEAKARLEKKGLTAFPPTPFSFTNLLGALRTTVEKLGVTKVSELKGHSEHLRISGVTGCHERVNCLEGLEKRYGLTFAGLVYNLAVETEPFRALETGFADMAMLPSTDGRLAAEKGKFATLEEDRHVFPAGNAILVTTRKAVEEAGPGYEEAIVAAQKGLTLPVMQELDARVELGKKTPAEVATEYLKRSGREG